ncbi:hypothetical protein EV715DRAFT_297983 [Schizophyllum commune]
MERALTILDPHTLHKHTSDSVVFIQVGNTRMETDRDRLMSYSLEEHIALLASLSGVECTHPLPVMLRYGFWESRVRVLLRGMDDFVVLDLDSWDELVTEGMALVCVGIAIGVVSLVAGLSFSGSLHS